MAAAELLQQKNGKKIPLLKPGGKTNSHIAGKTPSTTHAACACGGGCPKCSKKKHTEQGILQTKLEMGSATDSYEQEADRVADQILAAASPAKIRAIKPAIQRLPQQTTSQHSNAAPASVDKALSANGRPLDSVLQQDMSQRFGYDFSQVRIHADAAAEQSAKEINARAYTVGHNIVFGAGQFAPETRQGRHLLAHELTHVVQQTNASPGGPNGKIQRRVGDPAQKPADVTCATGNRLPFFPALVDVFFPNGGATLETAQKNQLSNFIASWSAMGGNTQVMVDGFASTDGSESSNWRLSCQRAQNVVAELTAPTSGIPGIPASSITFVAQGETDEFSPSDAALNRRVTINTPSPPPPPAPTPTPTPTPAEPGPVCGPDVTAEVTAAVAKTRTTFGGWSAGDKRGACDALDSLATGAYAWDIVQLHNQAWILTYRPACATQGATPPCGSTVKINSDCYYAGSPNYVIFGVMCQLCNSHFTSIGDTAAADRFTRAKMQYWVNAYKGTGFSGLSTPSGNFGPSRDWADAGYSMWPATASPAGDRNTCSPSCPTAYSGPAFTVHWVPHPIF